eukprot:m.260597 g.260597  ORF g.260597 m.260597 type:complete len:463 (-) comp17591_c0_seq15:1287-2675(-)
MAASSVLLLLIVALSAVSLHAEDALVPPKGLNTWDSFRYWVTEDNVLANANEMSDLGLVSLGWRYLVLDEAWYRFTNNSAASFCGVGLDLHGRYLPDPNRFPSATTSDGLTGLCAALASKNITCGVHLISGISSCAVERNLAIANSPYHAADIAMTTESRGAPPLNYGVNTSHPASQAYFTSLVDQLATWGIGFIKYDFATNREEVRMMRVAINNTDNNIVLSINGAGTEYANMYRISADVWDVWQDVVEQVSNIADHTSNVKVNSWPDSDMLPLGRIGGPLNWGVKYTSCNATARNCNRTPDPNFRYPECCPRQSRLSFTQQRSLLSMWSLVKSPLMFGGYLPETELQVVQLLQNAEIAKMSEQGTQPQLTVNVSTQTVGFRSLGADDTTYFGLFNLIASRQTVVVNASAWSSPHLVPESESAWCFVDLWTQERSTLAVSPTFVLDGFDCMVGRVTVGACA